MDRLLSDVRNLSGQVLLPRHDGIRVERINAAEPTGSGHLAIYVERSERRPHMSKAPDDGRYYKRGGTSTFPMEHFDIEDALKRVALPSLALSVLMLQARMNRMADAWTIPITLGMMNTGEVLARYPYISVIRTNAYVVDDPFSDFKARWRLTRDHPGSQLTGGGDDVIHVGTMQLGGHLYVSAVQRDGGLKIMNRDYRDFSIHVTIQYGAEGFRGDQADFSFNGDDIHEALRRGAAV